MATLVSKMSLIRKERWANKINPFHISGYLFFSIPLLLGKKPWQCRTHYGDKPTIYDWGWRSAWECCWAEAKSTAARQLLCEYCPWAVSSWRIKHWVPASYWPSSGLESQTASDYAITIIMGRGLQKLPILIFRLHAGNIPPELESAHYQIQRTRRMFEPKKKILAISLVSK